MKQLRKRQSCTLGLEEILEQPPGCYAMCSTADLCACLGCTLLVVMLCVLLLMCVHV